MFYSNNQLILIALWIPQAIAQTLIWTYWWQTKEYRFDRFSVLLKKKSGIRKLAIYLIIFKIIVLLMASEIFLPIFTFIFSNFYFFTVALSGRLQRPRMTARAKALIALTLLGNFIILLLPLVAVYTFEISILAAEIFLIIGGALGVIWTKPIVEKAKRKDLESARKKLSKINPTIVGVTGSYGKTTTKDFLAHILDKKYIVEKTTKNQNNEFGISRKILTDFKINTQIFVVEMGAYKKGEIKLVTNFARPNISMITGIEPQHIDLFGNIENIKSAKYEIVEALDDAGIAIFNLSNKDCRKLYLKAKKLKNIKVYGYRLVSKYKKTSSSILQGRITKKSKEKIEFSIEENNKKIRLTVPFTAPHLVENAIGAILVARLLKVSWSDIKKRSLTLSTPEHTMKEFTLKKGACVVDDTYNSTPRAFEAALELLLARKEKYKVVVTSGIIELGIYSQIVHKDLGHMMKGLDMVVLTDPDFASDIAKGMADTEKLYVESNVDNLKEIIAKLDAKGTVILLEGRLPEELMKYIDKKKS